MSISNIYLARHGETEYNRRNQIQGRGIDASLNETGQLQAKALSAHIHTIDIDHLYSSSLKRSRETAEYVGKYCNLELASYRELDEMNFGILEGRPIKEIEFELQQLHENWKSGDVSFALEKAESPRNVLERAGGKAEALIREKHSSNILFVLHGRLIRILVSHWLGMGLSSMHKVAHSNGALYHLQWDGKQFRSVFLNNTDHLINGSMDSRSNEEWSIIESK